MVAKAKRPPKRATKRAPTATSKRAAKPASRGPVDELRAFGLGYPEAVTKSPWPGHLDLVVRGKTFAFLSAPGEPVSVTCKLPHTGATALLLPFASATAYGLGKSGWVTAKLGPRDRIPVSLFEEWIDESYRAQAPKKLVAELDRRSSSKPSP